MGGHCIPAGRGQAACANPNPHVRPAWRPALLMCVQGVRLMRTDLHEKDLTAQRRGQLADALARLIPVGVGEGGAAQCVLFGHLGLSPGLALVGCARCSSKR